MPRPWPCEHRPLAWCADRFDATLGYPGEGPESAGCLPPVDATNEGAVPEEMTRTFVADPHAAHDASAGGRSSHGRLREAHPVVTAGPGAPTDELKGASWDLSAWPFTDTRPAAMRRHRSDSVAGRDPRPSYIIEIRNLPAEVGAQDVKTQLMRFGNLLSVELDDELSVAEYLTLADADAAQQELHGSLLGGRTLDVRLAPALADGRRERAPIPSEDLPAAPSMLPCPLLRQDPGKPDKESGPSERWASGLPYK